MAEFTGWRLCWCGKIQSRSPTDTHQVLPLDNGKSTCLELQFQRPCLFFKLYRHTTNHILGEKSFGCMRICKAKELGCISKCGHFVFHIEGTCFAEYIQLHHNLQLTKQTRQMQLDFSVYRSFES